MSSGNLFGGSGRSLVALHWVGSDTLIPFLTHYAWRLKWHLCGEVLLKRQMGRKTMLK